MKSLKFSVLILFQITRKKHCLASNLAEVKKFQQRQPLFLKI